MSTKKKSIDYKISKYYSKDYTSNEHSLHIVITAKKKEHLTFIEPWIFEYIKKLNKIMRQCIKLVQDKKKGK